MSSACSSLSSPYSRVLILSSPLSVSPPLRTSGTCAPLTIWLSPEPLMCVTAQCEWPMQRNPSPFIAGQQDFPDFQQPVKKKRKRARHTGSGKDALRLRPRLVPFIFSFFKSSRGIDLRLICHSRLYAVPAYSVGIRDECA